VDTYVRLLTQPHGQQPLGTTLAWAGFGAEELLRLRGPVEWSPGCASLFDLGHAQAGADQSSAVAQLVPAKLRRGRRPDTQRHRTLPALEPAPRHARETVHDLAGAENRHQLIPDLCLPSHQQPDRLSSFNEQRTRCAPSTGSAVVYDLVPVRQAGDRLTGEGSAGELLASRRRQQTGRAGKDRNGRLG